MQTAKLEDKLITNEETTTEIAKTPASEVSGTQSTATTTSTTTAVLDKESGKAATTTTPATAKVEAPKVDKVATVEKTETSGKPNEDDPGVCRQARMPPVLGCHRRPGRRSLPVRSTG